MSKPTVGQLAQQLAEVSQRLAALEAAAAPQQGDRARAGFLSFRHRARAIEDEQLKARRSE